MTVQRRGPAAEPRAARPPKTKARGRAATKSKPEPKGRARAKREEKSTVEADVSVARQKRRNGKRGARREDAAKPSRRARRGRTNSAGVASQSAAEEAALRKGNRRTTAKAAPAVEVPRLPRVPLRERMIGVRERARGAWTRVRRPLWMLARITLVLLLAAGAVAVGRLVEKHVRSSPAFATRNLTLTGTERLGREEVLAAAGLALEQNVFEVAPEDAQARLLAHPWIAEANVRRRLPDTFEVSIREHRAVAVLALARADDTGDSLYLLSEDGTVFKRVVPGDPVDLPVLTGVDRGRFTRDRAWRTSLLIEVVALLHDYRGAGLWRRAPIAEVHVEADDGLTLYVDEELTQVRLGRAPFRHKLRRLRRVFDRLRDGEASAAYVYLDNVRRPDRVTVRLR